MLFSIMGIDSIRHGYVVQINEVDKAMNDVGIEELVGKWKELRALIVETLDNSVDYEKIRRYSKLAVILRDAVIAGMAFYSFLAVMSLINHEAWLWLAIHPLTFVPLVIVVPQAYRLVNDLVIRMFRRSLLPIDKQIRSFANFLIQRLRYELAIRREDPEEFPMKLRFGDYDGLSIVRRPSILRRYYIAEIKLPSRGSQARLSP